MSWYILLHIFFLFMESCSSSNFVTVNTSSGILNGTIRKTWTHNDYYSFRGIPYAEPPIGKLRFQDPVPVKPWEGVKLAIDDGNVCPQPDPAFVGGQVDENCLYLNVYSKKLKGSLPVIIWIHPGAFRFMTGASFWYGPDYLLDHDVVLVSFNYRLDILGFLSTGGESAIGNYGLKDQVEVLKWVQKNIKKFGGNPRKVTLAGDSAGSAAALLHLFSPMSRGLFHNVIAMSGGIIGNIKWQYSRDQMKGAVKLSQLFNCPTEPVNVTRMIECLKTIPAKDLYSKHEAFQLFSGKDVLQFGPVVEPEISNGKEKFLLEDPQKSLKNKILLNTPIMIGFTDKEFIRNGIAIAKNETLVKKLNDEFDDLLPIIFNYNDKSKERIKYITNSIRKFYFGNGTINEHSARTLGDMFSDLIINYNGYETAKLLSQVNEKPIYFYKFSYMGRYGQEYDPISNKTFGPGHTNDISYVLYPSKLFPKFKENDPEAATVKKMTSMWYNFASTGHPTPKKLLTDWRPITEGKYLDIDEALTMEVGVPFSERMKLMEMLFPVLN